MAREIAFNERMHPISLFFSFLQIFMVPFSVFYPGIKHPRLHRACLSASPHCLASMAQMSSLFKMCAAPSDVGIRARA